MAHKDSGVVYARDEKGKVRRFSPLVWKNLKRGNGRAGFTVLTDKQVEELHAEQAGGTSAEASKPETSNPGKSVEVKSKYDQLIEQGRGFVDDKKYSKAIERFEEALELKESPYLKGLITKAKKALAEEHAEGFISEADSAFEDGDFETAKTLYQQAQELNPDSDYVTTRLEEVEGKLNPAKEGEE